jgi:hypothetical protein
MMGPEHEGQWRSRAVPRQTRSFEGAPVGPAAITRPCTVPMAYVASLTLW